MAKAKHKPNKVKKTAAVPQSKQISSEIEETGCRMSKPVEPAASAQT